MIVIVGYKINTKAFEDITKGILLQNKEEYDIDDVLYIDDAIYHFILDEKFNNYKDIYFPGISSLKHLIITRYCGNNHGPIDDDNIHIGYIVNRGNKNAIKKQEELETFKNLCPPHLLASQDADTFIFEDCDVGTTLPEY